MKLDVGKNKSIEWKDLSEPEFYLTTIDHVKYGNDYEILAIEYNHPVLEIFKNYTNIQSYFHEGIIYIVGNELNYHYMFDIGDSSHSLQEQINKDGFVFFGVLSKNKDLIEFTLKADIIF